MLHGNLKKRSWVFWIKIATISILAIFFAVAGLFTLCFVYPKLIFSGSELISVQNDITSIKSNLRIIYESNILKFVYRKYLARKCVNPIDYRLGSVDERFNLTKEQVLKILEESSELWEQAAGRDLFTYNQDSEDGLLIEFVYDERQKQVNAVDDFSRRSKKHEELSKLHEKKINAYNLKVEAWERSPGSEKELSMLQAEGSDLNREADKLNRELDALLEEEKSINSKGDDLHNSENGLELGIFDGTDKIKIGSFYDRNHLVGLMTHELGHALYIDHVDDENSIMNATSDYTENGNVARLSIIDIAAMRKACGMN